MFKDGRQETCYASGRIRVKDALGNLLVDTRIAPLSQAAAAQMASLVMPLHLMVWCPVSPPLKSLYFASFASNGGWYARLSHSLRLGQQLILAVLVCVRYSALWYPSSFYRFLFEKELFSVWGWIFEMLACVRVLISACMWIFNGKKRHYFTLMKHQHFGHHQNLAPSWKLSLISRWFTFLSILFLISEGWTK